MPAPRRAVQTMKPYVPGKTLAEVERDFGLRHVIKLNQNENPLGPSPHAVAAAMQAMTQVHTYPEGTSHLLRERLAAQWDLPADWFVVGNGSDEIFRLLAEVYLEPGDKVVVPTPSFSYYPIVAQLMGAEPIAVPLLDATMDLQAMAAVAARVGAKMIFLCRPNNPTGAVFAEEALRALLPHISPDTLVIIDEAYREFDQSSFDSRALPLIYPNVVVTRTFSKIYGMAGFRLGYGVMNPAIASTLLTSRDPFSVNNLAVAAGLAALDDQAHVEQTRALTFAGRDYLYQLFDRLGLSYVRSEANFVLFDVKRPATVVFDALLLQGVLVRPCASFGLPTWIRVTVGTIAENERFAAALEVVL
jgi:histidinol-phosphate aminotransferase